MKRSFLLLITMWLYGHSFAQSLFNWQHFYKEDVYFRFDLTNSLARAGAEEIVLLDKATLNYTRIPYPPDVRNLNYHNNQYWDTINQSYSSCVPQLYQGPDNKVLLRNSGPCGNFCYQLTNTSWVPFGTYQGMSVDSLYFLNKTGTVNYFSAAGTQRLYAYDGVTLSYFDSLNSPMNSTLNIYTVAPNNDILLAKDYSMAIYHNNVWSSWDTAFFNCAFINPGALSAGDNSNFVFYNQFTSKICIFNSSNASWQQVTVPSAMNHSSTNLYISGNKYDANGNLWLFGDSVFCRYDGVNFTDYFATASAALPNLSWVMAGPALPSNKLLIYLVFDNKYHPYQFDMGGLTFSAIPQDNQAVLPFDNTFPSLKDDSGTIWFGCYGWAINNGLIKYHPNGTWSRPDLANHGINGAILNLTKDTGNTVIMGYGDLGSQGPVRIQDTNFTHFNDPNNTYYKNVMSLAIDTNHHFWFGGDGAGVTQPLAEYFNGTITDHYNPGCYCEVQAVAIDQLGYKWVAYRSNVGVYKYDGSNWVNYNSTNSQLPNDTVTKILVEPVTGALWFCTDGGFARLENGLWTLINSTNSPIPCNDAENMHWGDDSSVYYATRCGFCRVKNGQWETYTTFNSPLDNSDIESIITDNNCQIWMTTEFGITRTTLPCSPPLGKRIRGKVKKANQAPAAQALVYVFKLNQQGTSVSQVKNIFTDNQGQFDFYTEDTGSYYFQAVADDYLFPDQITTYHTSHVVIQAATPYTVNTYETDSLEIQFRAKNFSGNCSLKGFLHPGIQGIRTGSVRVVLFKNNIPASSVLSNADGSFSFSNIDTGTYQLWIDQFGFDNNQAPSCNVDCSGNMHYFSLFPTYLSNVPVTISETASQQLLVYPNPVKNTLYIENRHAEPFRQIALFDLFGNCLFLIKEPSNPYSLQLESMHKGIYVLRVDDQVMKIIKE